LEPYFLAVCVMIHGRRRDDLCVPCGDAAGPRIFTIGHSNHDVQPFFALLARYDIKALVDVRSIPSSGRFPHFKKRSLESLCAARGVSYRHCPELGNKVGGIAHLLEQPEGQAAFAQLAEAAEEGGQRGGAYLAYMCAEADWRDCHRQVISQKLLKDCGIVTFHVLRHGGLEPHPQRHVLPEYYGVVDGTSKDECCQENKGESGHARLMLTPHALQVDASVLQDGRVQTGVSDHVGTSPSADNEAAAGAKPKKTRRWGKNSG